MRHLLRPFSPFRMETLEWSPSASPIGESMPKAGQSHLSLILLELPLSRFGPGRVMEILESEEIREKFSLTEPDVETIRGRVRNARVRWGIRRRAPQGVGNTGVHPEHLARRPRQDAAGYALPEKDGELFGETLPFDGIEGGASEVLGSFLVFTEKLFSAASGNEARAHSE